MKNLTNQQKEALCFLRTVTCDKDKADAIMAEASPLEIMHFAQLWRCLLAEKLEALKAERRLQEATA